MVATRRPLVSCTVGPITVRVGFDPVTGAPCEVFMLLPFKYGSELANAIHDANIAASKIMQGKEP